MLSCILVVILIVFIKLGLYRVVLWYIFFKVLVMIVIGVLIFFISLVLFLFFIDLFIFRIVLFIYFFYVFLLCGGVRMLVCYYIGLLFDKNNEFVFIYGVGLNGW